MTLDGMPYEEYRGWFISKGIIMPAQGVYEINVYSNIEDCITEGEPLYVAHSVEEAKAWIDGEGRELRGQIWEGVKHGSYIIFTNLDTGETKQYYNVNPPDSSEAMSAVLKLKSYLEERWGKNISYDIMPITERD